VREPEPEPELLEEGELMVSVLSVVVMLEAEVGKDVGRDVSIERVGGVEKNDADRGVLAGVHSLR
jgi:hypothetical protein